MSPVQILIVDDHAIVRQGLRLLLAAQSTLEVVGEAKDAETALTLVQQLQPQLVLFDLIMPGIGGIEGIRRIISLGLGTRILVLTSSIEDHLVKAALTAGAHGYILKASRPVELLAAIERVMDGETALDAAAGQVLVRSATQRDPLEELTEREREVFDAMARGLTNTQIAERFVVSEGTVRTHVANVLNKLELRDRAQVTVYALKRGLVRLDELP
ncbi:MAG: response regulator transcription factor [bacterium]|nr:response regulator transcription factor [bacterium]